MPLSNSQPFKLIKTKKETEEVGLGDIQALRRLLETKNRKDLSILLKDCSSYLEESSQYGSYLFAVISTFWIYVPPEKIEEIEKLSQQDKELLLELVRKIYPPKDYSPEIKEIKFRVLTSDIKNYKKNHIKKPNINLYKPKPKQNWHQKWWGQLLIGITITVIGGIILALIL